ncbi:MAG: CDP-diacylglycerol--glycerol-3-phosphate 3-phosphatidyltransferase [Verrucomicrobia bacterium]|nr:CDP-diacylglycerol--glycerol-3-phosphate 3-phosphatidyltransferase [Verrucomicrobiota bacterium]
MNLPNQLTLFRLVLTLPFVAALSINFPGSKMIALSLFLLGSITDYADGYIARRYQLITNFGKLMDPLVDKIMIAAAFICLVGLKSVPAWVVIVIVSREFLVTGLRLLAASRGQLLPAERLGKHKTVWQIATILYLLVTVTLRGLISEKQSPLFLGLDVGGIVLTYITVALTLVSGLGYFARNWNLVRDF